MLCVEARMSRTNTTVTVTVTAPPPVGGPPAITSAVLAGSTITISGGNFGVKTTPAPTFFQPFTGLANGATPTAAGFDSWVNRGGEAVTNADGVGGGSIRCNPVTANNAFPHIGRYLPAGVSELRIAFFFKVYGPVSEQVKFCRAGTPSGDPVSDYGSTDAKLYPSIWAWNGSVGGNSVQALWRTSGGTVTSYYTDESGSGSSGIPVASQPTVSVQSWAFWDVTYRYNTVGASDGLFRIDLNGFRWQNRPAMQVRTNANQYMGYIQPIPSIDQSPYDYAISRVYIDTGAQSVARVFLSNSATLAGVTQQFLLPATAWSATGITVTNASSIPSGYNYVYVTNPSGETNATGRVLA
jgi:hypothetical protein